jgi:glycosyltransferase involved in cell wall biosynthesis
MRAKQRNILIVVQNLPVPFDRRVWQESTSLRRAGFGVAVICPKKKMYTASYEQLEGVDIYRYPLVYEADKGVAGYFLEFVYCWLATLWLALKAYAHRPFHVIHACNPPDTYFALALLFRIFRVKSVFDHHDLCPEMYVAKGHQRAGLLYRGLLTLEWLTLRSAHAVIAVNESHKAIALRRGGIAETKVVVVRSGPRRAWADICTPCPALKRGHRYMVMYLGEMCEQDGVDHLLRAIQNYRGTVGDDTLFAFVGGGPDQPRMKSMAEHLDLGPVVHFTGRIPDEQLWAYLSTADVCVDPDPFTEWSNLSTMNKMIEYLAFGKPVVAFDLAEHRRTAQDAAAYVEPNNDTKLSVAIRDLLLDEGNRRYMGRSGQQRFRTHLAWENSEQELLALYSRLLGTEQTLGTQCSREGALT